MNEPKTILEAYTEWWKAVQPKGVSATQTEEMRRAFWTGATAGFWLTVKATDDPTEAQCLRNMDALRDETQKFMDEMNALAGLSGSSTPQ